MPSGWLGIAGAVVGAGARGARPGPLAANDAVRTDAGADDDRTTESASATTRAWRPGPLGAAPSCVLVRAGAKRSAVAASRLPPGHHRASTRCIFGQNLKLAYLVGDCRQHAAHVAAGERVELPVISSHTRPAW